MPAAPECEAGVISGVLRYPELIDDLETRVYVHEFYVPSYAMAWEEILRAAQDGSPMEIIELHDRLMRRYNGDDLDKQMVVVDGIAPGKPDTVLRLADRVREMANRRQVIKQARLLATDAGSDEVDVVEAAKRAIDALSRAGTHRSDEIQHIGDVVGEYLASAREAIDSGRTTTLKLGVPFLDSRLRLFRGSLLLIGATEKTGKTWLVQQVGFAAAALGNAVGWMSSEMDSADLSPRILGSHCGERWVMDEDPKTHEDVDRLAAASAELPKLNIRFAYEKRGDVMMRRMTQAARQENFDLWIVDYLQDFRNPAEWGEEYDAQVELASRLREFGKKHGSVIIVVSGMNKRKEENAAPRLSDVLGRRKLLHLMDAALLMHRPAKKEPGLVHCAIPGSRHSRDKRSWWIYRNDHNMQYEEIRADEAAAKQERAT